MAAEFEKIKTRTTKEIDQKTVTSIKTVRSEVDKKLDYLREQLSKQIKQKSKDSVDYAIDLIKQKERECLGRLNVQDHVDYSLPSDDVARRRKMHRHLSHWLHANNKEIRNNFLELEQRIEEIKAYKTHIDLHDNYLDKHNQRIEKNLQTNINFMDQLAEMEKDNRRMEKIISESNLKNDDSFFALNEKFKKLKIDLELMSKKNENKIK